MSEFVEIAKVSDLAVGVAKTYVVGTCRIALYRTASGFYATDNECPHRGGPLGEGDLIGDEITCPWHLWGFDVKTGVCPGNAGLSVATHEVCIEGDRVLVKLP